MAPHYNEREARHEMFWDEPEREFSNANLEAGTEEVQDYDDDSCCNLCDEPIDDDGAGHTRDCPNSEDYEEFD